MTNYKIEKFKIPLNPALERANKRFYKENQQIVDSNARIQEAKRTPSTERMRQGIEAVARDLKKTYEAAGDGNVSFDAAKNEVVEAVLESERKKNG